MGSIRTAKLNCYERYLTEKYCLVYIAIYFNLQCTSILGLLSLLYWYSFYFMKNKIRMKIIGIRNFTSDTYHTIHVISEIF